MGHVELKFILEMNSLISDDLVKFTFNYCCVAFNAVSFFPCYPARFSGSISNMKRHDWDTFLSFALTSSMWQYFSWWKQATMNIQVYECDPFILFLTVLADLLFPCCQLWWATEHKYTKQGRAALTLCHLALLDLRWEVTGPFCCL